MEKRLKKLNWTKIKEWTKKSCWIICGVIISLVIIPGAVQLLMTCAFTTTSGGSDDGWLGFWGGYLGTILGIPISVMIAVKTIKEGQRQIIESKQFKYHEKISECATKFQIEIQSTTRYPLDEERSVKLIKLYNSRINKICTTSRDSFFTEYNINRAKLPEEKRDKHLDTIKQLIKYLDELGDKYINFSKEFDLKMKKLEFYIDEDDLQNYNESVDNYYTEMKNIKPLLTSIAASLSEISDLSIEEIKF
ncbi:apurinic/apyrimidinic endonuclease family protein [Lactiplantibacillus plantarum]|uniref:hypothetical protein n=1 Tax=Lactiplantibacillus plantarum TaxID=1590 RepID=UPI000B3EBD0E|nr:hypothetical protein [Lactiplantibacillus plantarum]ARW13414.1 hypothetical protein S100434_01265 [Lactiplantibacillus plantarum subsp. plantarum]QHM23519.1 hypothetical protein C7M31_03034 [Lactiplantibacillus plantarum]QHM23543.1 hypothetical protein C7M32_00022 [Lactiplantibacillus plantarum]QHM29433.1 hypothetical protein C7M33_03034 [Lactiplantibacillus plantarum]